MSGALLRTLLLPILLAVGADAQVFRTPVKVVVGPGGDYTHGRVLEAAAGDGDAPRSIGRELGGDGDAHGHAEDGHADDDDEDSSGHSSSSSGGHGSEHGSHSAEGEEDSHGHGSGSSSSSGGHGSDHGGHVAWWAHDYERSYVEVLLLIFLVVMALAFETVWHHCLHEAEHSYAFGHLHELVDGVGLHRSSAPQHAQLTKELANRAGGEFMTLGFLAFFIFAFNNGKGFEWMVTHFPGITMNLPTTSEEWLHMAEIVHINLFVGMCIYFFVLARVVQGCLRKLKSWEQLGVRRKQQGLKSVAGMQGCLSPRSVRGLQQMEFFDVELAEYTHWREYFVVKMGELMLKRPVMFQELLRKINISQDDVLSFQEYVDNRFAFSAYLAFSVEDGVLDSIRIHPLTWCFVIVIFVAFACIHRFLHVELSRLMPFCLLIFISCQLAMLVVVKRKKKSINRVHAMLCQAREAPEVKDTPHKGPSAISSVSRVSNRSSSATSKAAAILRATKDMNKKHNTESLVVRMLQILLFLMSYVFAHTVLDLHLWDTKPDQALLYTVMFTLLFVVFVVTLPEMMHLFLGIMALPPYVDATNFATFCAVLDCHDHSTDKGQVGQDRARPGQVAQARGHDEGVQTKDVEVIVSEEPRDQEKKVTLTDGAVLNDTDAAASGQKKAMSMRDWTETRTAGHLDAPVATEQIAISLPEKAFPIRPVPEMCGAATAYGFKLRSWLIEVVTHSSTHGLGAGLDIVPAAFHQAPEAHSNVRDPAIEADTLLAKFQGREDELIEAVIRERGIPPPKFAGLRVRV